MYWLFYILIVVVVPEVINLQVDNVCDFKCSHVYDPVCGLTMYGEAAPSLDTFTNICHLRKARCTTAIEQMSNSMCGINNAQENRRLANFDIVGAHQVCNHTCPTHCIDTYEPACAQIWWDPNKRRPEHRVMINHCHIDLFSCAVGVNVTIVYLGKCYKNPSGLLFMNHVAAMKTLHLFDK